jgi:hypothetical protein
LKLLALDYRPSDVPIEIDQHMVGRQGSFNPGPGDPCLDLSQQIAITSGKANDLSAGFLDDAFFCRDN